MAVFQTKIRKSRFVSQGYTGEQMTQVGNGLISKGIIPRIRRAVTTYDTPAPRLTENYRRSKVKKGRDGIRDWTNTGQTLRSLKVTTAQPNRCVIEFTTPASRKRAYFNNRIIRQFGVSQGHDAPILAAEYRALPKPVTAQQVP